MVMNGSICVLVLAILLKVHFAKTEWILIVELHQFNNLLNAQMIPSHGVCCCDSADTCAQEATDLQKCFGYCDVWLSADVSHCIQPYPCSFSTPLYPNTAFIKNLKDKFIFGLSTFPDTKNFTLTIQALDYDNWDNEGNWEHDEIDMIAKSIPFLVNNDEVKVEENGINGIGWFNFSYRVQNSDSQSAYQCSIDSATTTVTNPLSTSCTCHKSVPIHDSVDQPLEEFSVTTSVTKPLPTSSICIASAAVHNSIDQPLEGSSVTTSLTYPLSTSSTHIASVPVDNSTDQPLAVSSSSLWALIAVAIMLLITLFVTIIIAICIVRNMSTKLKKTKDGTVRDSDVFEGNSSNRDLHNVPNALYDEMSLSNAHYTKTTLSETPAGQMNEVATSAVEGEGYPYEIPVPLHVNDGGIDK